MLKSLFRYKILSELNNGITVSIRKISSGRIMYGGNEQYLQNPGKDRGYYAETNNDDHSQLKRDWVSVNGLPRNQGFVFTLLNYNILSQQLLEYHSYLYRDHQNNALRWNQRFYNLVGEIFRIQPDLCMFQVSLLCWKYDIENSSTLKYFFFYIFSHLSSLAHSVCGTKNKPFIGSAAITSIWHTRSPSINELWSCL